MHRVFLTLLLIMGLSVCLAEAADYQVGEPDNSGKQDIRDSQGKSVDRMSEPDSRGRRDLHDEKRNKTGQIGTQNYRGRQNLYYNGSRIGRMDESDRRGRRHVRMGRSR